MPFLSSPIVAPKYQSKNVGVALTKENQEALLPIISAKICGPKKLHRRGNVLFDSGVQLSLIKQETAESLGLKGKD